MTAAMLCAMSGCDAMRYIQRKDENGLETVDEFETYKEARAMLAEYRMADTSANYYISTRACRAWKGE